MELTRRALMQGAMAGATLGGLAPRWAHALVDMGGFTVETLSDGHLVLPADFIFGPMPKDLLGPVLQANGITAGAPLTPECNLTLLRHDESIVLFDAGSGPAFQETAGKIADALGSIDLAPEDITHVVFTHGHPDHLWGVLDDFDDPFFSEAQHFMGQTEFEYWMNPETVNTIEAERTTMAVGAQRRLAAMEDAMTLFGDGDEILPGVAARMTPGHTPGHMSFEIRSGSNSLLVIGDAIGNHHVAFAEPTWHSGSDQDKETAAATRTRLFDQITADQMRIIGFHLPGGGMGHAERRGAGYRFIPDGA